jgi:hypothetical protein
MGGDVVVVTAGAESQERKKLGQTPRAKTVRWPNWGDGEVADFRSRRWEPQDLLED